MMELVVDAVDGGDGGDYEGGEYGWLGGGDGVGVKK